MLRTILLGLAIALPFGVGAGETRELSAWEKTKAWTSTAYRDAREVFVSDDPNAVFAALWDDITPKLDAVVGLQEEQAGLPESAWFGRDQRSAEQDINQLLADAVGLLGQHRSQQTRRQILALESHIEALQADIEMHQRQRITAPQQSVLHKTVEDHADIIEQLSAEIVVQQTHIDELKQAYRQALAQIGLELTQPQLDFLLSTVVGDQVIDISVAFDNVKVLTEKLEILTNESQENMQTARKYYGMYTILLKVLDTMYAQALETIDAHYMPTIDAIVEQTQQLQKQTQKIKRTTANAGIIQANAEAQRLTLKAANLYRRYLTSQRQDIEKAQQKLAENLAVAENTYATVRLSGELVGMMRSGRQLFDILVGMQLPTLRTFQNRALQSEFTHLTKRISALE